MQNHEKGSDGENGQRHHKAYREWRAKARVQALPLLEATGAQDGDHVVVGIRQKGGGVKEVVEGKLIKVIHGTKIIFIRVGDRKIQLYNVETIEKK